MNRKELSYNKIIVRFPNWLGDCVMAAPILSELRRSFPDSELHLLVRGGLVELFADHPYIDKVMEIDDKSGYFPPFNYFSIAGRLRPEKYDLGLILPDSFSSALIFYLAGIPERIGYGGDARAFMLTKVITRSKEVIHRSIKYRNILRALGLPPELPGEIRLCSNRKAGTKAAKLIGDIDRYIVIAPHSRAPSRRWGLEKYAQLAAKIFEELQIKIVLLGAGDEREIAEYVGKKAGIDYLNLAGESTLMVSYEIMKGSLAYIGNDSGGAHLAAAAGTYTISISGADDPDETRPLARKGRIIRKSLPCSPCVKNVCPRDDFPNECMHVIEVDEVFEAICEAVNGK